MEKKDNFGFFKLPDIKKCLKKHEFLSVNRSNILVFILYIFLTIIFTYPVSFSKMIPGDGDAYQFLWFIWWYKKALLSASSPYFSQYIFYPTGVNLAFSAITPFNGIVSIPLQYIFGLTKTYNILWLSSYIFSGYGTYLLVKYLTGDLKAAFIAGLIFMFSPYHAVHALGHLNLLTIEWIPFYVLYLLKTVNEQSSKNAVYASFFLLLAFLSEYTYAVYLSFFTALYLLYLFYENKNYVTSKSVVKRLVLMGINFTFLVLPFAYPLLKELLVSNSNYMYNEGFVTFSADLLSFFIPAQFHPVFGQFVNPFYENFTGNVAEFTVFAGYAVLILSIIAFLKIKTKEVKFWVLSTAICFVFCLGPLLHINGIFTGTVEDINFAIPLPYAIIMKIPIVSIARAPSRWDSMVMLSLSVLSGYGLSYINKKYESHSFRNIPINAFVTIIFTSLILFEFLFIPYPMGNTDVPEFYYSLSGNSEDFAIFEIPDLSLHVTYPEYMYYQTVHGKKLVTGYAHQPETCNQFTENTPVVNDLYFMSKITENDILNQDIKETGLSILNYYNIRYIILHKNYMTEEQLDFEQDFLNKLLSEKPDYYKNDSMYVYQVESAPVKPFQLLGDGWYDLEEWNDIPTRWMSSNASLSIYSNENCSMKLRFQAMSFHQARFLEICKENSAVSTVEVSPEFNTFETPVQLHKGENSISFQVLNKSEKPYDIPDFDKDDSRSLAVAMQNITIDKI